MQQLDTSLFYMIHNLADHGTFNDSIIIFLASKLPLVLSFVVLCLLFAAFKHKNITAAYYYCIAMLSAHIARDFVSETIRIYYHKVRPFRALHVPHLLTENTYSFPSGHTIFFFALSAGVFMVNGKLGWCFFVLSLLMGIARIAAGVHYPLDVLGGAILGITTTYIVAWIFRKIFKTKFV